MSFANFAGWVIHQVLVKISFLNCVVWAEADNGSAEATISSSPADAMIFLDTEFIILNYNLFKAFRTADCAGKLDKPPDAN